MQREKHWNSCTNRLYYACFYAVSALLQQNDFTSGKPALKRFSISILSRLGFSTKNLGDYTAGYLMLGKKETILTSSAILLKKLNLG